MFNKDFIFGVASSAYQIEGREKEDGAGRCIWDTFCEDGGIADGSNAFTACDHIHRYKEDFRLMKYLGIHHYRFSLSWSRLMPEGIGKVNEKAVAMYRDMIECMLENEIVPYLTLFHWEYPQRLQNQGGWLNERSGEWFAEYAALVAERFSDLCEYFITMNEPQCFCGLGNLSGVHAPGYKLPYCETFRLVHNVLKAHGMAVKALRAHAKRPIQIGFAPTCGVAMPYTDAPEDVEAARKVYFGFDNELSNWTWNVSWYSDPVFLGHYPEEGLKKFARYLPEFTEEDMELIHQPIDFLGQNIYNGYYVRQNENGNLEYVKRAPGSPKTATNWPITPECLYWGPRFLYERYKMPIFITENGMSCHDQISADGRVHDQNRIDFLNQYLCQLQRAVDEGVAVKGYFVWTFLDNFEWEKGYNERFGMVYVDFGTQKRIVKDSAFWYQKVIECCGANLIGGFMSYQEEYQRWCTDPYFDEATRQELLAIKEDENEIEDRFYRQLEFGTGGLRGVIGAGTNRMNIYTVRQATQGLANYIISRNGQEKGVAIAYDSRIMSPEFAEEAALCFNANGIKTYRFESLRPTPELSYAVRKLGCISGIVITASHNPREYNGYKVYWEDGAQITPPHDKNILAEVAKVTDFSQVKTMEKEIAVQQGLYHTIGKDIDDAYMQELKRQSIHPDIIQKVAKDIKIVYTPLHGTGNLPVRRVLKELGFEHVFVVKEQELPDGNFPTVAYPNPEDEKAWTLALKLAKEVDADIILATDPDADRLGVYAKDAGMGEYVSFTGNMSGMLIAEYILRERTLAGTLPERPALVETIVTTDMAKAIAADYGAALIEVLTGFKYIGEQIKIFEQSGSYNYVFGLEESYGCLAGTYARDKDACVAVMMLCEVAAFYKNQGKTLWDAMLAMYEKYGYYKEGLATLTLKGIDGAKQIQEKMNVARNHPPKQLGGHKVFAVRDYLADSRTDFITGNVTKTGLPSSNVLYYELEDNSWCCVRPSGTEPKIKYYFGVKGTSLEDAAAQLALLKSAMVGDE